MSRLAKKPLVIPAGVTVQVSPENVATVKGPKGTLTKKLRPEIKIDSTGKDIKFTRTSDIKAVRALHGTTKVIMANMIQGVTDGFSKEIEAVGVGYRFAAQGKGIQISLGFSHPIEYNAPEGITIKVAGQTGLMISGVDKELVGKVAAEIRAFRSPEPYKGKGLKYKGEHISRKAGKAGKAAGGTAAA